MRSILVSLIALSLGACATVPGTTGGMYQPRTIGDNLYTMSEMDMPLGGDVLTFAARFCTQHGGRLQMQGNAGETGSWSGTRYQRIIFSCQDVQ